MKEEIYSDMNQRLITDLRWPFNGNRTQTSCTLLPFIKALSGVTFSGYLKILNKVKKNSATMRIHSKWNLYL
jgi:hypothetical protein